MATAPQFAEFSEQLSGPELNWELHPMGAAALDRAVVTCLAPGSGYSSDANALHRVSADPDEVTVTLFVGRMPHRSKTEVFTALGEIPPPPIPKSRPTPAAYRAQLIQLRHDLGL